MTAETQGGSIAGASSERDASALSIPPEAQLLVTARSRGELRLDAIGCDPVPPDPPTTVLAALARTVEAERSLWVAGGEPTLRADLPELIALVASLRGQAPGLVTDGLALVTSAALAPLRSAGLRRVRIALHSARPGAHDFLTGIPGSARLALRAVRTCLAEGLEVEIEAAVGRVNTTHLAELAELAGRMHATALWLRRLVERGHASEEPIRLLPRIGLLEPHLEHAVVVGLRHGTRVRLRDFPPCAAPKARMCCAPPGHLRWLVPADAAWSAFADALAERASVGACHGCPGMPRCAGAPVDYVARFGLAEFHSEPSLVPDAPHIAAAVRADRAPPTATVAPVPPPPPRAGRAPATRVRAVQTQVARGALHGDPMAGAAPTVRLEVLRVGWRAPTRVACAECAAPEANEPESARTIRQRLVRAAQEGASTLRIAGAGILTHPHMRELLKECGMLSFARVEVACEGSMLAEMNDTSLRSLAKLNRFDVALYGHDAAHHDGHMKSAGRFESTLGGIARFADLTGIEAGAYAILHDARSLGAWAQTWDEGRLPGAPAFRLASRGDDLRVLADTAGRLPDGPARRAITPLLPPCVLERAEDAQPASAGAGFDDAPDAEAAVAGSDRLGRFTPCRCGPRVGKRCPGIAAGWAFPEHGVAP